MILVHANYINVKVTLLFYSDMYIGMHSLAVNKQGGGGGVEPENKGRTTTVASSRCVLISSWYTK